jgi:hypothetical protein
METVTISCSLPITAHCRLGRVPGGDNRNIASLTRKRWPMLHAVSEETPILQRLSLRSRGVGGPYLSTVAEMTA